MAATHNVLQSSNSGKSLISKSGVLTIHGFGVSVRMQSGHLEIEDGVGPDRRKTRLPRVGHGLRRLVCISEDGFTTLGALKWLAAVDASFVILSRNGKVLFVTGPTAPSDVRLRRAQALALGAGVGFEISRTLIDAKIEGQERLVREGLNDPAAAQEIARLRARLSAAGSVEVIRTLEAHSAVAYFGAWRNIPILWPKADLRRVPDHWRTVGRRPSPLSGGPRLAVTPVHAVLNYCFGLLESESRLALAALGLDPGLGLGLHTDTPNRDSLALDILEPVRPKIESWVLSWITREPLRRADFFETPNGNCRLMPHLCAKLSETAPTWGKLVAPWAEYVAHTLWANTTGSKSARSLTPASRLTQQHRREARGRPPLPLVEMPKPEVICRGCGRKIRRRGARLCARCAATATRQNFDAGRKSAQQSESLAKRSTTQRQHKQAIQNWKSSDLSGWLTRDVYLKRVQPALVSVAKSQIRSVLGVSEPYSSEIKAGKRIPHPRHWLALAQLVRVSPNT
jgi:CRISPR-associated endonuclease Cas1